MLGPTEINDIVADVAGKTLGPRVFLRALSEPAVSSRGEAAIRVTIVIKPRAASQLMGGKVIDTLVGIRSRLRAAGEERLAIVGYATEKDLVLSGDPES